MDNVLNLQRPRPIQTNVGGSSDQERLASHFNDLYRNEIKEDTNNRFITNVPSTNSNFNGRYRQDNYWTGVKPERNKVKFSDTVTVAVVPVSGFVFIYTYFFCYSTLEIEKYI